MSSGSVEIYAMQGRLNRTRQLISASNLVTLDSRKALTKTFEAVAVALNRDITRLPRKFNVGDKNLTAELRRVSRGCVSVIQALNDRSCSKKQAIGMGKILNKRLRRINRILMSVPDDSPMINQAELPAETPDHETTSTIKSRPKHSTQLKSFSELEQYQQFIEDMRTKVRMLENTDNKQPAVAPTTTVETPAEPVNKFDSAREGEYGQRMGEDIDYVHQLLRRVQPLLPKPIKFKNRQLYIRVNSPLLVVTQRFVPDSVFKSANIKFDRMYRHASLEVGYIPGFGGRKDTIVSPVVLYNQWLMAVPLPVAMNRDTFNELLEYAVPALGEHVGGVTPLSIGMETSGEKFTGQRTINKYADRLSEKWNERESYLRDYLLRIKENRHDALPSIPPDDLLKDAKLLKQVRSQRAKGFRVLDERRRYFTNKHYPGVAFVWLMLNHVLAELHNVRFTSINFPVFTEQPQNSISPGGKFKTADEESYERMEKLRKQREALHGDVAAAVEKLAKLINDTKKRLTSLEDELEAEQAVLQNQQAILSSISDKHSPAWRAAHEAMELTFIRVAKTEGEIDALKSDVLPQARQQKDGLTREIAERIRLAAEQRKNERRKK